MSSRFLESKDVSESVRNSIKRAISKSGLGSAEEEGRSYEEGDGDGNNGAGSKSEIDNNSGKVYKPPNGRFERLKDIVLSRRGYIVFVSIFICVVLIGNIVLCVFLAGLIWN